MILRDASWTHCGSVRVSWRPILAVCQGGQIFVLGQGRGGGVGDPEVTQARVMNEATRRDARGRLDCDGRVALLSIFLVSLSVCMCVCRCCCIDGSVKLGGSRGS